MEPTIDLTMLERFLMMDADIIREALTTRLDDDDGWEWVPIYASPFDPYHPSDDYPYDEIPSERIRTVRIDTQPAIIIRIKANDCQYIRDVHIEFTEEGGRLKAACGSRSFNLDRAANIRKHVDHAISFIKLELPWRERDIEIEPCEYGDVAAYDCKNLTSWLITWLPEG